MHTFGATAASDPPPARAHFIFETPWQGGFAGTPGASTPCARRSPNPTDLPSWPDPQTGRSAGTDTAFPAARLYRPTTQPFLPALRTPLVPLLSVLPQVYHPNGPPFPARSGPPAARAPTPLRQPLVIASHGKPGFQPSPMATTRGVARFHRGRLTKRQQAGALQTLREFQGAVRGRGSAGSLVACCCYGTWAGVEPGPPQASRGRRLCLKLPVPPDGGMASTPSGLGGTRSTASDGGMRSTASLGPGETGASMESLPSGRGGTRPSNGQWRRLSNPSGRLWKAEAGCEVSERSAVVRKRQQAGALQTLRDLGGAGQGRGSAWNLAA